MTREDFQAAYAFVFDRAQKVVARGEEHEPMILLIRMQNEGVVDCAAELVPAKLLETHQNKNLLAEAFNALSRDTPDNSLFVLIVETWVLSLPPDTKPEDYPDEIKDHAERGEAITMNFRDRETETLVVCKIDRSTKTLERAELFPEKVTFGGRFTRQ